MEVLQVGGQFLLLRQRQEVQEVLSLAVLARMMPPRPAQPNGERLVFHQTPAEMVAACIATIIFPHPATIIFPQ